MNALASINTERRLYVLECGGGFTCLGFDNAERAIQMVSAWMSFDSGKTIPGTLGHYARYEQTMRDGSQYSLENGIKCPIDLTPALIGLEGRRVEVLTPNGEHSRFWVGKSGGWLPVHLEIKTRRSLGGGAVYFPDGSTLRVIR